jgi:hypothetical protein
MAITDTDLPYLIEQRLAASAAITALVSTRIRPMVLNENESIPAIRYEMISSESFTYLGGSGKECRTRIQIDCYGSTTIQAAQVAAAVKNNLDGLGATALGDLWIYDCVMDNRYDMVDRPEPGSKHFRKRRVMDFVITHTEPSPSLI